MNISRTNKMQGKAILRTDVGRTSGRETSPPKDTVELSDAPPAAEQDLRKADMLAGGGAVAGALLGVVGALCDQSHWTTVLGAGMLGLFGGAMVGVVAASKP